MDEKIDGVLDKYAEKINTTFESEPEELTDNENVETETSEVKNDIIGKNDLKEAELYLFFDMKPQWTSQRDKERIEKVYDYLVAKGDSMSKSARELQLLIGAPTGMNSKLDHFYSHIRIQEAMNANQNSPSRQ